MYAQPGRVKTKAFAVHSTANGRQYRGKEQKGFHEEICMLGNIV